MNHNISAILLVSFALILVLVSPTILGDGLRGSSSTNDNGIHRETQPPAGFFSFLTIAQAVFGRVVALILSLPAALLKFLLSLFFFGWNFIAGLFISLSVSFTTTTTTTLTTVGPMMTVLPLTTSSAGTISSTITADLTSASATTTGTVMMSSMSATATPPISVLTMSTATGATGASTTSAEFSSRTTPMSTFSATTPAITSTTTSETPALTSTSATSTSTSTTATPTSIMTTLTSTSTSATSTKATTANPSKTVFVTSQRFNGNLGGLEGADDKCSELALVGKLTGRFMSWTSNITVNPLGRFSKSTGPYVMLDGRTFADNFTSLVSSGPNVALNVQEDRQIADPTFSFVWTNTNDDGSSANSDCDDWTDESLFLVGNYGSVASSDMWTADGSIACDQTYRLYCFEQ